MTTTDRTLILATAEALLELQLKLPSPLDYTNSAWGDLKRAIHKTMVHYFLMVDPECDASALATRLLDEAYRNGENLAYQITLLANGEITL